MLEYYSQVLSNNSILFLLIVILIIAYFLKSNLVILSHWHHTYDKIQFSTQDFYNAVDKVIKEREMLGVSTRRTTHKNRIFLSGAREYLRVTRNNVVFDICAAPNGTGVYISWWHHEQYTNFERLVLMKVPIVNWTYKTQTLHQHDLELMFEDMVHTCVREAADAMTGIKGSTLSEAERSIIHNWSFMK